MAEEMNKIGLHDLIEKEKLADEDIILIEDNENTKRISFRDFRDSLITDNELPSEHRMYSSMKLHNAIQDFRKELDEGIGKVEGDIEKINADYMTERKVDQKITEFAESVPTLAETETLKTSLESKRDINVAITCDDIESGDNSKKIQPQNLSSEVIAMMTGETPITPPAVPAGGWVQEDIANEAINSKKLARQYRYKGHYPDGNINNFIYDGLYLLGASVEGLPKYDENETDQNRLLEVTNYGPNQNIIQRLYYCEENTEFIRPVYERKAELNKLHVTDFIEQYQITNKFKITRNVLDDNIFNMGFISTGSVYDLVIDGDYFIKKNVKDLPNNKYDFTVSVRKYDTRVEYTAKAIGYDICEVYISNTYVTSSGGKERTRWYQTNTVTKSRLDGKRLHLFGDGICFGMGSTNIPELSYPALLTSRYGLNIVNHALGDATIGVYNDEYLEERSVIKQIENAEISNGDLAIIFAGSNDYKSGAAKIGNNHDINDYSFKGALNTCIEKLMKKNPNIKVLIVSPLFRARLAANDYRNSDETAINELYLRDYSNAMKEVADYNHIPFLDLHSSGMINKYNFTNYLSDRFYPNDNGHDMLANKIFAALNYFY